MNVLSDGDVMLCVMYVLLSSQVLVNYFFESDILEVGIGIGIGSTHILELACYTWRFK